MFIRENIYLFKSYIERIYTYSKKLRNKIIISKFYYIFYFYLIFIQVYSKKFFLWFLDIIDYYFPTIFSSNLHFKE